MSSKFSNFNFKGLKVLVRVDFNVPLDAEYNITDDTRMSSTIPTIKKILTQGGSVILMSHFGRPKEGPTDKYSLKHLVNHLKSLLNANENSSTSVFFADDTLCVGWRASCNGVGVAAGRFAQASVGSGCV